MILENLVIPFQINNKIKGTIVRLSSVASQVINDSLSKLYLVNNLSKDVSSSEPNCYLSLLTILTT